MADNELTLSDPRLPSTSAQPTLLQTVMQAVLDPTIDPARLEKFLQIGRELEADKAKREWGLAFRAAKDEIDGIRIVKNGQIIYPGKNGAAPSTIKFARYEDLADAVKPILRKNALTASYTYRVETTPPKTVCVMKLLHAGGHSENFESIPLPLVDDGGGKNAVQGAGSVMTYGRRYAVQAAFDIVAVDEDDDGSGRGVAPRISEADAEQIHNCAAECEGKQPGFLMLFTKWMLAEYKVDRPESLNAEQAKGAMAKLREKMAALGIK
jgi:hypothetical protein